MSAKVTSVILRLPNGAVLTDAPMCTHCWCKPDQSVYDGDLGKPPFTYEDLNPLDNKNPKIPPSEISHGICGNDCWYLWRCNVCGRLIVGINDNRYLTYQIVESKEVTNNER